MPRRPGGAGNARPGDRVLYRKAIRSSLERQPNLRLFQQAVDDLLVQDDRWSGRHTIRDPIQRPLRRPDDRDLPERAVHVGLERHAAGRAGDPPSIRLAHRLTDWVCRAGA